VSSVNELDQATLEEVQERLQRVDTLLARAELEVRALLKKVEGEQPSPDEREWSLRN